jgi:catalase
MIAILVADGVDGEALAKLHAALTEAGAVPRFVAPRLGSIATADGDVIEADASMENSPAVLFDGLVLPDGDQGVAALGADGHTMEFVTNQYRHCKTILVLGASSRLVERAGINPMLGGGGHDPGLLFREGGARDLSSSFIEALSRHRHIERETDPPAV